MVYGTVARSTARMLERRRVTRAGVTRISVLGAVGGAVWFSRADMVGGLAGSAFLASVLFCDAVRVRMRADRRDALTRWLAAMLSQLREYVVYLGLAVGAVLADLGGAWGWAAGALVALALRDSLLVAHAAPLGSFPGQNMKSAPPPSQERTGSLLGGLVPRRPVRDPRDSDPALTGRLLGASAPGDGKAPRRGPGANVASAAGAGGAAPAGVRADGAPPGPREAGPDRDRPAAGSGPHRAPGAARTPGAAPALPALARRLMVFSQPTRFLVIAVTATLWDARVAFVTLIVGCTIAVTGELVDPTAREVRR
ncbi:hypothetical protein Q8791_27985 [Nocardiopsis sp. CT-R113]|uniref:Integral membrane protein n=1 Tax=Nocardiopsis codii TaxID=3065942 RepID=A0ABU7KGL1_9ACTN|nr:hypothetical protein [Nocardiopsis sp. CT-R113]